MIKLRLLCSPLQFALHSTDMMIVRGIKFISGFDVAFHADSQYACKRDQNYDFLSAITMKTSTVGTYNFIKPETSRSLDFILVSGALKYCCFFFWHLVHFPPCPSPLPTNSIQRGVWEARSKSKLDLFIERMQTYKNLKTTSRTRKNCG